MTDIEDDNDGIYKELSWDVKDAADRHAVCVRDLELAKEDEERALKVLQQAEDCYEDAQQGLEDAKEDLQDAEEELAAAKAALAAHVAKHGTPAA